MLPKTVIYDPRMVMSLPARIAAPSGMNAIAHCVEALYAIDANPIVSMIAQQGIRALAASLPRVVSSPGDAAARAQALYGAWLAGTALVLSLSVTEKRAASVAFGFPRRTPSAIAALMAAIVSAPERFEHRGQDAWL